MKNCYVEDVFKTSSKRLEKQEMFAGLLQPVVIKLNKNYTSYYFNKGWVGVGWGGGGWVQQSFKGLQEGGATKIEQVQVMGQMVPKF